MPKYFKLIIFVFIILILALSQAKAKEVLTWQDCLKEATKNTGFHFCDQHALLLHCIVT